MKQLQAAIIFILVLGLGCSPGGRGTHDRRQKLPEPPSAPIEEPTGGSTTPTGEAGIAPTSATGQVDVPELAARVKKSVVTIVVSASPDAGVTQGTGFVVGPGLIATNNHVIAEGNAGAVHFAAGPVVPITNVVATDVRHDLALIAVEPFPQGVPGLRIAERLPREGEPVLVVGSPLFLEHTISTGIVSSVRQIQGSDAVIQITAPISPGSSGSPVVDQNGIVVGIATFQSREGQALNFAIPSSAITALLSAKPSP